MMKLIIPVVAVLSGAGAGIGAGLFTQPKAAATDDHGDTHETSSHDDGHGAEHAEEHKTDAHSADAHGTDSHAAAANDGHGDEHGATGAGYLKIPNQFVVPIVRHGNVKALAVVSISLEIDEAERDTLSHELPRIKALTLQTLLNHAALGGFDGNFADLEHTTELSQRITDRLRHDVSHSIANTLLLELARQDL